jgi:tetratricopeptide (TPR) repeat protein
VPRPTRRLAAAVAVFLACAAAGSLWAARSRVDAALARGDLAGAAAILERLAWLRLDAAEQRFALALSLRSAHRLDEAVVQYERALARSSEGEQWAALAATHVLRGDAEAAIRAWDQGFEANHDTRYLHRASRVLLERGEKERAFAYFERAQSLDPDSAMIQMRKANMAHIMNLPAQEIRSLREAIALDPALHDPQLLLAWRLATSSDPALRDIDEAVRLAEALAARTGRRDPNVLDTLAAALAAAGRYDAAVLAAAEARDLAARRGDDAFAAEIRDRLSLYRSGRAYVEAAERASG